jgi:hypothetical protein
MELGLRKDEVHLDLFVRADQLPKLIGQGKFRLFGKVPVERDHRQNLDIHYVPRVERRKVATVVKCLLRHCAHSAAVEHIRLSDVSSRVAGAAYGGQSPIHTAITTRP